MKLSWKWVYCSIDTIKHPDKGIIIIQIKFSAPLHSLHYKLVFAVLRMQKNCSTATACTCHLSTFHKNRSVKRKQRASKIHTTITHNKRCTTAKQRLSQNPSVAGRRKSILVILVLITARLLAFQSTYSNILRLLISYTFPQR